MSHLHSLTFCPLPNPFSERPYDRLAHLPPHSIFHVASFSLWVRFSSPNSRSYPDALHYPSCFARLTAARPTCLPGSCDTYNLDPVGQVRALFRPDPTSRPCYRIGISQRFVHPPATRAKPYKLRSMLRSLDCHSFSAIVTDHMSLGTSPV